MGDNNTESRAFSRVPFRMVVELKEGGKECPVAEIRDLSMNGIFLEGDFSLAQGASCEIKLRLEGVEPPIEINLKGEVQRVEDSGVGIQFKQIPLESYEHLNRIVQLNSQNPHQSEEEIKGHVGLNQR